jgi:predicted PurR-regulated permease PerM
VAFRKIVGNAVSLPVIVIVPGVITAAAVAGPLGTVIVVPILGFAVEMVGHILSKVRGGDPYSGQAETTFLEGFSFSKRKGSDSVL